MLSTVSLCWYRVTYAVDGHAVGRSNLGQYTLLGPQLHQHRLQVTEVLIIGELAGTQLAPRGITVGHPHGAGPLQVLQGHRHDDWHICHVRVVVQLLFERAQLAGGGCPAGGLAEINHQLGRQKI